MFSPGWTISRDGVNTSSNTSTYLTEFKRPPTIHISPGPATLIHPQTPAEILPLLLFACKYLSSYLQLFGRYRWSFWCRSVWNVFSSEKTIRLQSVVKCSRANPNLSSLCLWVKNGFFAAIRWWRPLAFHTLRIVFLLTPYWRPTMAAFVKGSSLILWTTSFFCWIFSLGLCPGCGRRSREFSFLCLDIHRSTVDVWMLPLTISLLSYNKWTYWDVKRTRDLHTTRTAKMLTYNRAP